MEGEDIKVGFNWKLAAVSIPAGLAIGALTALNVNLKIEQFIWLFFMMGIAGLQGWFLERGFFKNGFFTGLLTTLFAFVMHAFRLPVLLSYHPDVRKMVLEMGHPEQAVWIVFMLDLLKGLVYAVSQGVFNTVMGFGMEKLKNQQ